MAIHRFAPRVFHATMGEHPFVLKVKSGDTIVTETLDAHGFDLANVKRGSGTNPMTGPFFVEGAAPGDTLAVSIRRISMNRNMGWTRSGLAWNVVEPVRVREMPTREKTLWRIANDRVVLETPPGALKNWSVAVDPMIGCFGVAPAAGEFISTATSGRFGGNMDYRQFRTGTTAFFPVSVEGALMFVGDAHAAQGDGEIAGTGIETSAEVEFQVDVIKRSIGWPRGETADAIFTVGNARPLEEALQHATTEMLAWLAEDYGLDTLSASHLLGMGVRYDIANVFNPAFSVACKLEKSWLAAFAKP
jgi:amidase